MTTSLSNRDTELLSAYLDGELSAGESAALEQRLRQDSRLQAELESLQTTVALLGMAERVSVPHNFTLDPAVYGKPARANLWERLNLPRFTPLAAAGAAIVAVLVCAGVFILASGLPGGGAAAPDVAMLEAESAAEEPAFAAPAEKEMMEEAPEEEAAEEAMELPAEEVVEEAEEALPVEEEEAAPTEEPALAEAPPEEEAPVPEDMAEEEMPSGPPGEPPTAAGGGGLGGGPTEDIGGGEGGPEYAPQPTALQPTLTPSSTIAEQPEAQRANGETRQAQVAGAGEAAEPKASQPEDAYHAVSATPETGTLGQIPARTVALIAGAGVLGALLVTAGLVILLRRRR
jgi:hypothetical protein